MATVIIDRLPMNLPNQLTVARLFITILFVAALSVDFPGNRIWALALFLVATLTDYLDGVIARKWNLITDFGKLMDPLADKVLSASAFILLIGYGAIPAWAVILIISREFLITGLRLLAISKNIVLPAEKIGKHKTAWQMITIIFFLILLAFGGKAGAAWITPAWDYAGTVLVAITVILTAYSGIAYGIKHRDLITSR